jgi:hypothetical protein
MLCGIIYNLEKIPFIIKFVADWPKRKVARGSFLLGRILDYQFEPANQFWTGGRNFAAPIESLSPFLSQEDNSVETAVGMQFLRKIF